MQKVKIKFVNFRPSNGFKNLVNQVYQNILFTTPKHSKVRLKFEKNNGYYIGYGFVLLAGKTFTGSSSGINIYSVLDEVENQLRKKIYFNKRLSKIDKYKKSS